MRLLVDTNALLYATRDREELTQKAQTAWTTPDAQIFYSPVSLWELVLLSRRGRLGFELSLVDFEKTLKADLGLELLQIKTPHLQGVTRLPFHHNDPFDRLLIAQAAYEGLSIVTSDRIFDKYEEIERVW